MPKKEKKPRFVITRRIYPTEWQKRKIDKEMNAANFLYNFLYNMSVRYYGTTLEVLIADPDFEGLINRHRKWYKDNPDSEKANPYQKGVSKTVHKFKRKRRFGRSVLRRAPGGFDKMLREKVVRYGGVVILLDPKKTASSQTNESSETCMLGS